MCLDQLHVVSGRWAHGGGVDLVGRDASLALEHVDVLRVVAQQEPLALEQLDKVVRERGLEVVCAA